VGALLLDFVLADPWEWFHPVQAMGWAIAQGQTLILRYCPQPWQQQVGGAILTSILVGVSYSYAAIAIELASRWHTWAGTAVHILLLASCLGAKSLRLAALSVLAPLERGDWMEARQQLSRYVGRDTSALDEVEICRALVETVAENTPDGATAPLFYGLIGGAPLAFAYKAISTLDSMVGYRHPPFTHLGRFPARLEDALTWLPCRLTVLTLALWSDRPLLFWRRCQQDARKDPSPNSGWSEAAFAWQLGIRLGGSNVYRGIPTVKPFLGVVQRPLTSAVVLAALGWLRQVLATWIAAIALLYGILLLPSYL
jgi:adenosylcobinamide-phosphate synthase